MPILEVNTNAIKLFWNAANYLSAGMLYLKENPLLRETLDYSHFKDRILGHWGACPGVNAIYAHVSDLVRRTNSEIRLIVGTGHAGPAMLSCTYLDGSLGHYFPSMSYGVEGIKQLFVSYANNNGFSTEINPNYPGTLYVGGELGSALAFTQGYAMQNPDSLSVCIIGDGELETSITQASWQGFRILSKKQDGKILPVINANGYKMGSKALFALMSREERGGFLSGHGLTPIFVETEHAEIATAFSKAYSQLMADDSQSQPVIILESPKGWTAPKKFKNLLFEGSCNAHKPIVKNPSKNIDELRMIENWLRSYNPNRLFDDDGIPYSEVTECLPPKNLRLGYSHRRRNHINPFPPCLSEIFNKNKVSAMSEYICEIASSHRILILSPDEMDSNRFSKLTHNYHLKSGDRSNNCYNPKSPIIEILNEHLCFTWAQGYSRAGKTPIIITYEAFAPIFSSLSEQYLKNLNAVDGVDWQPDSPSINIILTSLGWFNTPTHHNPSFTDSLVGRNHAHVRIYMPVFAESSIILLNEMLNSRNRLNIMIIDKHTLNLLDGISCCYSNEGYKAWTEIFSDSAGPVDITFVAIGDRMAEQALCAKDIIHRKETGHSICVIAIEDLSLIENDNHPDLMSFRKKISNSSCTIWIYNGFPKTIKSCLWDLGILNNISVLGYIDNDQTSAGDDRFIANHVSSNDIAKEALRLVHSARKKGDDEDY
ncbi:MAG: Xylulose-5-phosphate phosphoketolase [Syntrophomonadaceae bacterium]|nr:Xylulose-5-phosphate phosphoketolase [Bacillota bacterium]